MKLNFLFKNNFEVIAVSGFSKLDGKSIFEYVRVFKFLCLPPLLNSYSSDFQATNIKRASHLILEMFELVIYLIYLPY